jgi:Protein of unknown function (DUF3300)
MSRRVKNGNHMAILSRQFAAITCSFLLITNTVPSAAAEPSRQEANATQADTAKIPNEQLDSLVAPIALYPDPLLAQVLAASTYPLEIMQLQQWLGKNKNLKDKALVDAVEKQAWDASVQALAPLPDVVKRLSDEIQWTTDLGNAFLAQQSDVMDAVQRMRMKAKGTGNLKSSEQQTVETKVIENKSVVVIEPSKPDVVYIPSYDPMVVYGPPVYPYPPIYYPPPGYYAAGMAISFGVGLAIGAAWGGGWGWGCGWGGNNSININNNNNFVRNSNRQNVNNIGNRTGNNTWQHNPQHRGGTPYSNRATAQKFGGTTRGDSMANRQAQARQNQGQLGGRQQGAGSNRASTGANDLGTNRGGSGRGESSLGGNRASGAGGGDRIGNRSVSQGGNTSSRGGAFGGGSGGMSGSTARASGQRGASSMGGARGGGGRGGGGRRR